MTKLAIHGGDCVRSVSWPDYPILMQKDIDAVNDVLKSRCLTGFRAGSYDGGPYVRELEDKVKKSTGSKHAIAFDTWSNGIYAILHALNIGPGDEVVLPSYTMTACASMIIAVGAIPVFCDIDPNSYCMSPDDVSSKINSKTKAIIIVHLFGNSAEMNKLKHIATVNNLWIIEDCAQAPMSYFNNERCGTMGHVGGFSFTQNKHVTGGEGGVAITNCQQINDSLRYIRNHGEICTLDECRQDYAENLVHKNIIGFNFRMTEMSAALASSQYDYLESEILNRRHLTNILNRGIYYMNRFNPGNFEVPIPNYNQSSSYFMYTLRYVGTKNKRFVCEAFKAEGINVIDGYCKPIHKQSIYHKNRPWPLRNLESRLYDDSMFPETNKAQYENLIVFPDVRSPNTSADMTDILSAISKLNEYMQRDR